MTPNDGLKPCLPPDAADVLDADSFDNALINPSLVLWTILTIFSLYLNRLTSSSSTNEYNAGDCSISLPDMFTQIFAWSSLFAPTNIFGVCTFLSAKR